MLFIILMNHWIIIDEMSTVQFIPHSVPDGHLDCFDFYI